MHEMIKELEDCPVIAAVKDEQGLRACLKSESSVVFVLYGDICSISTIVEMIKEIGRAHV